MTSEGFMIFISNAIADKIASLRLIITMQEKTYAC